MLISDILAATAELEDRETGFLSETRFLFLATSQGRVYARYLLVAKVIDKFALTLQ
jgi:hypothetical protein